MNHRRIFYPQISRELINLQILISADLSLTAESMAGNLISWCKQTDIRLLKLGKSICVVGHGKKPNCSGSPSTGFIWVEIHIQTHFAAISTSHFCSLDYTSFPAITTRNTWECFSFQLQNTSFLSFEDFYYFLPSLFQRCNCVFLSFSRSQSQTARY